MVMASSGSDSRFGSRSQEGRPSAPPPILPSHAATACARAGLHLRAARGMVQAACWGFVLQKGRIAALKAMVERAFQRQCLRLAAFFTHSAYDISPVLTTSPDNLLKTRVKNASESDACSDSWGTHAGRAGRKHVGKRAMRARPAVTARLHKHLDLAIEAAALSAMTATAKAARRRRRREGPQKRRDEGQTRVTVRRRGYVGNGRAPACGSVPLPIARNGMEALPHRTL